MHDQQTIMNHYFSKTLDLGLQDSIQVIKANLAKEGFEIITEIELREALGNTYNIVPKIHRIVYECNHLFSREFKLKKLAANLPPCNVIVNSLDTRNSEINIVDPVNYLTDIQIKRFGSILISLQESLKRVIRNL